MKYIVGEIENEKVIYIKEKNIVFCKNTSISFDLIKNIEKIDRHYIDNKSLEIYNDGYHVTFGCLTTTVNNCKQIIKNILKIKKDVRNKIDNSD